MSKKLVNYLIILHNACQEGKKSNENNLQNLENIIMPKVAIAESSIPEESTQNINKGLQSSPQNSSQTGASLMLANLMNAIVPKSNVSEKYLTSQQEDSTQTDQKKGFVSGFFNIFSKPKASVDLAERK